MGQMFYNGLTLSNSRIKISVKQKTASVASVVIRVV